MTEVLHFFGKRFEGGKIARFFNDYNDEAFDAVMEKLDGNLPQGFLAWHIPQSELDKGSKRIDKMKELPLIVQDTYFGEQYVDAVKALLQAKDEEEAKAEEALYLYSREVVKEQVETFLSISETNKSWRTYETDILVSVVRRDERLKLPANDTNFQLLHSIIAEKKRKLVDEWSKNNQRDQIG